MGKLDRLLGRNLNGSKLKILLNLAISRLAVLRNQRQARCHLTRSDIVQILNLGHHDRALIRVEQVIKEQNMLEVFTMIEGYCNLLAERINLLKQEKECPEELREAVSGILYASKRCGEFPELIEMREILTSRFGKQFAASAIELRNNCAVNPKMIQKLSTRQPILENRLKVLKEIAAENNIVLKFEEDYSITTENIKSEQNKHQMKPDVGNLGVTDGLHKLTKEIKNTKELSDSIGMRRKYKDVADAAQAAFESAAYAAAAAKIAVELSRSESNDSDDQNISGSSTRVTKEIETTIFEFQPSNQSKFNTIMDQTGRGGDLTQKYDTESENEEIECDDGVGLISSLDEVTLIEKERNFDERNFDKRNQENGNGEDKVLSSKTNKLGLDMKSGDVTKEDKESIHLDTEMGRSLKRFPYRSEAEIEKHPGSELFPLNLKRITKTQNPEHLEEKRPVSVRTRPRVWKH